MDQSSKRWISPIIIRLLVTLNPSSAGSICLPFFPFFFPPFPPCIPSDGSGTPAVVKWDSCGAVFFSISIKEVSDTSLSLQEEERRKRISFFMAAMFSWFTKILVGSGLPPETKFQDGSFIFLKYYINIYKIQN